MPLQVLQVRHRATGDIHAMKVMKKERILQKDHGEYVRAERDVLTSVVHPYIVNLRCSFQVCSPHPHEGHTRPSHTCTRAHVRA